MRTSKIASVIVPVVAAAAWAAACGSTPKTTAPPAGPPAAEAPPAPPPPAVEDLVSAASASGFSKPNGLDWPPERAAAPAADTFKNVRLLGQVSSARFMTAMQSMEPNLGVGCDHCHSDEDFSADTKDAKKTARLMLQMAHDIDVRYFDGTTRVTCYTCHRHEPAPEPYTAAAPPPPWPLPELSEADSVKPAREVYANLKVLGDAPASAIQPLMTTFSQALGTGCIHCHVPDRWAADDKPAKARAREMLAMVGEIGDTYFAGEGKKKSPVRCATCHRGDVTPKRVAGPMIVVQAALPDGGAAPGANLVVGPPEFKPATVGALREAIRGPQAELLSGVRMSNATEAELGHLAPGDYSLCTNTLPADRKAARDPSFAATPVTCAPLAVTPEPDVQTVTRQLTPL